MEPIKFENNIREKLQEREITPSNTAWKKLETQLNTTPQKRTKKSVWFAIAAGFIGIVIIASFIFNNDIIPSQNTQKIVSEPVQKEIETPLKENSTIVVAEEKSSEEFLKSDSNRKGVALTKEEKTTSIKKEPLVENIAMTSLENPENTSTVEINKEEDFIDAKVDEVVAQVQALEKNNNSVSSEEIDALLLNAQKEIEAKKILNKQKVNATALLNAVETELETSFRDKVFEALGSGYEKVRTAVVERNN